MAEAEGEGTAAAQPPSMAGRRRRRLAHAAEGEGTAAAQPPSAAGRRRRRLAAAEGGEGEAGEGATASKPSATDRVGCFPPFTKWQDFEVWLALTNKGALPCSKRGGLDPGPAHLRQGGRV